MNNQNFTPRPTSFAPQPYCDPVPQSNWNTFYYFKNVFDDKMIFELEEMVHANYKFEKGRTGLAELGTDSDDYEHNNRDIAYIKPAQHSGWLYNILFPMALEANEKCFHFDIDIVTDPIHYVIYPAPTTPQNDDGGHLDWHMDVGAFGVNRRKLAMTVQLSDSSDYEGGEFEIWMGGKNGFITVPREKGDVVVFPSFLMHRVKPITRGERKCLVFWTGGRQFR
jgi:PKHD-type hydroxylase